MSGLVVLPGEALAADRPSWVTALENADTSGNVTQVPWRESTPSAPQAKSKPAEPAKFAFPAAAKWQVPLGEIASAQARPVRVKPKTAAAGETLSVEVFDRATADRVGASGFVFKVSGTGRKVPVELSVDYSSFADAFGAGYGSRLQVVALPECALAGCATPGTPLPTRNDPTAQTLAVDVADVSQAGTFAVISAVDGEEGSFAATPLSISGTWQVAPGSGAFTYSYPIDLPKPAGGSAPSVSLSHSSAAVDGLTGGTNTQASPIGLGWSDFANAYIERRYEPCLSFTTTDLCWKSDNAVISLSGISGPLVPVNSTNTEWRALSDPGWKIERLSGATNTDIYGKQYWKVTGPDGTKYFFGYGHMPGRYTNSILSVPVTADNPNEPCRITEPTNQPGTCEQGWRWYLDRVVDPDGNVQSLLYEREDNRYWSALASFGGNPMKKYHRGAVLKEIIYGGRDDTWDSNVYSARVIFGLQWRCILLGTEENPCPAPARNNPAGFPDAPVDLICGATEGTTCKVYAPSFFTGRRYTYVRAEVKVGSDWKKVVQHNLYHSFNDNPDYVAEKLQLESIQHAGIAFGKLGAYPHTSFGYDFRRNRVDNGTSIPRAMRHNRLQRITTPFGGHTLVGYGLNRECPANHEDIVDKRWDLNDMDCFPQYVKQDGHLTVGVFNKYLVTEVVEVPGDGSPNIRTTYSYEGTPAWAYDTAAFVRDEDEIGWSVWRGYGTMLTTKGSSKTRVRVFRGWHEDWMLRNDGSGNWSPIYGDRRVEVSGLTGGGPYEDHRGLAGRVLEEVQLGTLNGTPDTPVQSRRHEYERRTTFNLSDDFLFDPEWAGLKSTTESVFSAPGLPPKQRRSVTTYNQVDGPLPMKPMKPPQPTTTLEEGWLDVTGDERCSITTYADNATAGMYVYPAVNKKVAGQCNSTQVLSLSETYYDGSTTLGAAPTKGNATRHRTQVDASRWSETKTEYDALGRPIKVTGPTGDVTTTAFGVTAGAPVTQTPVKTTITNALGHQVVTDYHPEFAVPKREQDANGNVTEKSYDEFGRLIAVWSPTEPMSSTLEPSWRFSYDVPKKAVRSRQLVSEARSGTGLVFEDTWVIYDGFWRERQTQGYSTVSGKTLVSETTYDDRGLVRDEMVEQALPGTPGKYIDGGTSWLNRTRHSYDELGREVRKEWMRGNSVAHATTTSYGVDTVTVTGPDGRQVRERVDGLGRTVSVGEYDGQAWVSSTYGYDLADRITSVVDPAGNRMSYTYNLAGWRTGQQDPNRGNGTFEYDVAGRQTKITDALSNQIHNTYDVLGRQLERHSGSPTGPLLASWVYDTAPRGKGALHRETTHTARSAWVSETLGYDTKSRPTGSKVVVPAGIPGLSGTYTTTQTYDRADRVRSAGYAAIGGLPAETVTTDYNKLGLPTRMAGLEEYVSTVVYDDRGRKTTAGLAKRADSQWVVKRWTYNVDQQVNGSETLFAGSTLPNGIVSDHELGFDFTGNLTEKLTRQNGSAWRECFGYDVRSRLTSAHTVAASTACAGGTPGTGDKSYVHSYQYSPDGKLTQRVQNGTATTYSYPAAGSAKAHAPTKIGATTYTWDARGSLASRGGETFSWDVQGQLQSVTNASGPTSFVYDASGQRLLRSTPAGLTTLYLGGHEVTANATGTLVSAVRPYTFDGEVVATRTGAGVVEYLISDPAGSIEMAVTIGGTAPVATRAYEPYGKVRSQTGDTATDRGFIGQIEDASTGLSYLNARYYDTAVGLFVSTDPIYDTEKPKSLNPYSYSVNNPTTFADPNGMYSSYAYGVERENSHLRKQNKDLIAHIGRLNSHIDDLQDVIRKQQKQINKLISYVRALEAEIERQASIIRQLQARVAYLERVVVAQQREISRLRYIVARQQAIIRYQAGVIRYQAGVISYYKGVVNVLGFRLWGGTPQYASVMASIHSFRGIPAGAFAYDNISRAQAARLGGAPRGPGGSGGGAGPAKVWGGGGPNIRGWAGGGIGCELALGPIGCPATEAAGEASGATDLLECIFHAPWGQNVCSGGSDMEEPPPIGLDPGAHAEARVRNGLRGCTELVIGGSPFNLDRKPAYCLAGYVGGLAW